MNHLKWFIKQKYQTFLRPVVLIVRSDCFSSPPEEMDWIYLSWSKTDNLMTPSWVFPHMLNKINKLQPEKEPYLYLHQPLGGSVTSCKYNTGIYEVWSVADMLMSSCLFQHQHVSECPDDERPSPIVALLIALFISTGNSWVFSG